MQKALDELQKHTSDQFVALTSATAKEHHEFLKAVEEQQRVLSTKLTETSQVLDELKNLVAVKDSIAQLAEQGQRQQEAQIGELQAIKSAISGLASSGSQQTAVMERLIKAIERIDTLEGYGIEQPSKEKKVSAGTIVLIVVGILTCLTIMGTCGLYIYKILF